jgi:hypothetical protein
MINDFVKATGAINILHLDSNGSVIANIDHHNLVVTSGKNYITSRMKDTTKVAMSHMGLGSGTVAPAAADTALGNLVGSRIVLDSTTVSANTVTYIATFGPGVSTGAITEAGIFNAATGADMLCRTTFAVVNKSAADTIIFTWNVTIN